jgi:hypothetical protein
MDDAACIRASGPLTLPAALRNRLEEGPAAWLDWLLDVGRLKKAGRPPLLNKDEVEQAVRARAALRVRGGGGLAEALSTGKVKVPEVVRLTSLGLLVDGVPDGVFHALLSAHCSSPAEWGAWALGLSHALDGHPRLGVELPGDLAEEALARVSAEVARIAATPGELAHRNRQAVYRLLLLPPRLCRLRAQGRLPVDAPGVRAAIRLLMEARDALPASVRSFAGRDAVTAQDEPIAVAIDHLEGRTGAIPSTENA